MKIAVNHLLGATVLLLHLLSPAVALAQSAKDTLVIGMSQYPPSLHPGIEPTVAKTYAIRFGYRPISAYNDDRKMECFLCTEVPTITNGRAKTVDLEVFGLGRFAQGKTVEGPYPYAVRPDYVDPAAGGA